jgi:hypothetical protein
MNFSAPEAETRNHVEEFLPDRNLIAFRIPARRLSSARFGGNPFQTFL